MKIRAALGVMAAAVLSTTAASAADEPDRLEVEVYGTLLPFFENVGTFGATNPQGFSSQTNLISTGAHLGINHERRFRMTSGTSNVGFRGYVRLIGDHLKLIWQVESPAPIDGEGPSNWAGRNSHVGFSGWWGALVYGAWDTPMRWATVTSINPIPGGYTGDMTAIIGTPGHAIPAWNADQTLRALFEINENPVGFFRHEPNSVQYWSPTVGGFSARLMYSANEHRTAGVPGSEAPLNPWLASGSIGYDNTFGSVALRIRASAEIHKDFFGTRIFGVGPGFQRPTSTDYGLLGLASVTLNADTDHSTRIVATADYLAYHTDVDPMILGDVNDRARPAFYALVHQKLGSHNIWGAYGQALPGTCSISGGTPCATIGLGALYPTLGYMYDFVKGTSIYALGYLLYNDVSAQYTPFPVLDARDNSLAGKPPIGDTSAGAKFFGVGIGFVHSFSAKLWGGDDSGSSKQATPQEREKLKAEIKAELKEELKEELRQELKDEMRNEAPPPREESEPFDE